MKKIFTGAIMLLMVLCYGCKRVSVDFSYSPTAPKAGDSIQFSNQTSGGEDYQWNFGDNSASKEKNPVHIYKEVGTYFVTLTEVKSKKSITHTVTIVDSLPSFTSDTDSIQLFIPVKLKAQVWNPYKHPVQYEWQLSKNCILKSGRLSDESITVFYTQEGKDTTRLVVTKDGVRTVATQVFNIHPTPTPNLLIESVSGEQYQQRIHEGTLWENARPLTYQEGKEMLAAASTQTEMKDTLENKVYYTTDGGLKIKNRNGENVVTITTENVQTITMSLSMNRLFYATGDGVYMLPLIHTDNNQFTYTPEHLNNISTQKMVVDETLR